MRWGRKPSGRARKLTLPMLSSWPRISSSTVIESLGEALALVRKFGVDPHAFLDILTDRILLRGRTAMIKIWGIEVTQATQFFQSTLKLCAGPGTSKIACPDNNVPLVAGKPTVLRLYVSGLTVGANVAATAFSPSGLTSIGGPTFSFAGISGMITASVKPATRTDPSTTLQVVLRPTATLFSGRLDLVVLEYAKSWPNNVVASATASIALQFVERRRIRIRLVRIHYKGLGKDVAPPTQQDFWGATDFAQRVLPIPTPGFEIIRDSVEPYDGNFTRIDPSAHDPSWPGRGANNGTTGNLLNILDGLAAAEALPADVIYVGMYPDGVNQAGFAGWSVGRWVISSVDGQTLAHEILHHTGSPEHAPCGVPGDPNYPDYPAISGLPAGSIGEVGFDSTTLTAYDPLTTFDLMSYCSPKWISPFNYLRSFQFLSPLPPPPPPPPKTKSPYNLPDDRFVPVSFVKLRERWVVVDLPSFPRPFLPERSPSPRPTLDVVVRDQGGGTLFRGPAPITTNTEPSEVEIPDIIQTEVPWLENAAQVELCHHKAVLARISVDEVPALEVSFPPSGELEHGRGLLSYRITAKAARVAIAVRASRDGGATWSAMVTREREGSVDVSSLLDGSGDECLLETLATSGYHTAVHRSEPFRVRPQRRSILAWSSASGGRVRSGERIELFAIAEQGAAHATELSWCSDLDGELGQGARLITALRPGRHRIEVRSPAAFVQPAWIEVEVIQS